ncbi:monothiol glutaredoxin [Candidatus Kinetoplastibacterium blastocrithidii TCC012E]|uniref:Glutaredoxin n=1 Tax=Candidatus Kinetoplastidibacterium blastocrithidiae TCC012E TaxID=1208922 RepID=M1LAK2_9PROT|nr:Grx4 family monothiol glutaredoxin [Candidatus Kinetoplastibacterium blastocrithidii]AFZ83427.1 monothiol glutaredoxin [Candidatus Kinetoplastibacterium blastocrithidii (ex Strigomonas culicis)]AGF49523.1 monothiol glutaredoxin [Candidatus Kinetoplastibacterium blastocrithidii TCC012E]
MKDIKKYIDSVIRENKIVLFMKGSLSFPMCGFSGKVVRILKECSLNNNNILSVNVLEDDNIRQGIKDYSDWPTIPQLYIDGCFIGGADIVSELYLNGELKKMLEHINFS